jgi:hypothetical protein
MPNTIRQQPPMTTGSQRWPPANLLPPGILLTQVAAIGAKLRVVIALQVIWTLQLTSINQGF